MKVSHQVKYRQSNGIAANKPTVPTTGNTAGLSLAAAVPPTSTAPCTGTHPEVDLLPLERLDCSHQVIVRHAAAGQGKEAVLQLERRDAPAFVTVKQIEDL